MSTFDPLSDIRGPLQTMAKHSQAFALLIGLIGLSSFCLITLLDFGPIQVAFSLPPAGIELAKR